jgi:hypothetical protein
MEGLVLEPHTPLPANFVPREVIHLDATRHTWQRATDYAGRSTSS